MERNFVASTDLLSVGYDAINMVLEIEFKHGGVYRYTGVPQSIYTALVGSSSKGTFFHARIKDRFPTTRIC
jgi:hypothetical protein